MAPSLGLFPPGAISVSISVSVSLPALARVHGHARCSWMAHGLQGGGKGALSQVGPCFLDHRSLWVIPHFERVSMVPLL